MTSKTLNFLYACVIGYGMVGHLSAAPLPKVTVSIAGKFAGDGRYTFKIVERGIGSSGKYTREYSFVAPVKRGLALPSEFGQYRAIVTTARVGSWETQQQPIAGYCLITAREDVLYIEIELVELIDQHPTSVSANGIHALHEN